MSAALILTKGYKTLVPLADLEWLSQWRWCVRLNNRGIPYAVRGERHNGKNRFVHLHREIYRRHYGELPDGLEIDHRNRDSLNNHASNLRSATRSLNNTNRAVRRRAPGREGWPACVRIVGNSFTAQISFNGKSVYIGSYKSAEDATMAVQRKRQEIYGHGY